MSLFHVIKQLEERNVANEINYMVWSDRMDLVAISNVKGDVALHRLTWTRAWCLGPPKEGLNVKGMAWRPDGKILAVAYSSKQIYLINVENKSAVNIQNVSGDVTCIYWVQEKDNKQKNAHSTIGVDEEDSNDYMKYIDFSKIYLKEPPVASENNKDNYKSDFLCNQNELNMLLIGTKDGFVYIKIFGSFTCAILDISEYLNSKCSIENIHVNENLSKIFITVRDHEYNIKILIVDSQILKMYTKELFAVAYKYLKLTDLISYLSGSITSVSETWESILLEIDNKLSKYASKVPQGGVTADFLDLLMFGIRSDEMEEFLLHDLTKKGLEKFGETIEMSYFNIQKLLLKNIIKFGQSITYHLAEFRGMSRMDYRYGIFGLSEDLITHAISSNGSFLIKACEMQQIINHSVINYKAFFRWLYTAIMNLMDEPIPSDIHKMTQQDLAYITEFLQNFDNIGCRNDSSKSSSGFIMERLGQYLSDGPLSIPSDMSQNEWTQFLTENECIKNHPGILKHYPEMSLIQQFDHLKSCISKIFENPKDVISKQFTMLHVFNGWNFGKKSLRMSFNNLNKEMVLGAFVQSPDILYLLQVHVDVKNQCLARCGKFHFSQFLSYDPQQTIGDNNYQIVDVKFYSNNMLSVLLQEKCFGSKTAVILQFSLPSAVEKLTVINVNNKLSDQMVSLSNGSNLLPKLFKIIDGMAVFQFAVSGSRRVGIVLAENRRKVRLFEMEADEEDDDDADMSSSILKETDVTMQDEEQSTM